MQYNKLSDVELAQGLKRGKEAAFTEIYNRYWMSLYETAITIIRDDAIAQDVVQEIFISLWNRRQVVEIKGLKAYLNQAVRFGVLKAIRSQKVDDAFYTRLKEITSELVFENPLLFKEQQQFVKQILDELPDDCKETFRLSREEQLTYTEIALKLEISVKTVEKRMTKSLKFLRSKLKVEMCLLLIMSIKFFQ